MYCQDIEFPVYSLSRLLINTIYSVKIIIHTWLGSIDVGHQ